MQKTADEMDGLSVHEPGMAGWCAATPANETMDAHGVPSIAPAGFAQHDPRAPRRRVYDDPEVNALREHLRQHNGLTGLEICEPDELERIARIFHRDGFVVVRDLLDAEQLARWRDACVRVLKALLCIPGPDGRKYVTETERLPHRYSYGTSSACRQLLHEQVWADMVDLPTTTPILERLFATSDYLLLGAGGDLCLPGAVEYQVLHVDHVEDHALPPERIAQAERLGVEARRDPDSGALTARTQQLMLIKTSPIITINFAMSDLTWENGPIRHIPGTHALPFSAPDQLNEPEWMRMCALVGAPAGAGIIRDSRAWHGATPNLSRTVRALPNVEYCAPWLDSPLLTPTMPHAVWQNLSPHAQHVARRVVTAPGEVPVGAGVMHPLAAERARAIEESR